MNSTLYWDFELSDRVVAVAAGAMMGEMTSATKVNCSVSNGFWFAHFTFRLGHSSLGCYARGRAEGDDDDDGHGLCLFGIGRIRLPRVGSPTPTVSPPGFLNSWGEPGLSVLVYCKVFINSFPFGARLLGERTGRIGASRTQTGAHYCESTKFGVLMFLIGPQRAFFHRQLVCLVWIYFPHNHHRCRRRRDDVVLLDVVFSSQSWPASNWNINSRLLWENWQLWQWSAGWVE